MLINVVLPTCLAPLKIKGRPEGECFQLMRFVYRFRAIKWINLLVFVRMHRQIIQYFVRMHRQISLKFVRMHRQIIHFLSECIGNCLGITWPNTVDPICI